MSVDIIYLGYRLACELKIEFAFELYGPRRVRLCWEWGPVEPPEMHVIRVCIGTTTPWMVKGVKRIHS